MKSHRQYDSSIDNREKSGVNCGRGTGLKIDAICILFSLDLSSTNGKESEEVPGFAFRASMIQ